jgi:hypothetical protein
MTIAEAILENYLDLNEAIGPGVQENTMETRAVSKDFALQQAR